MPPTWNRLEEVHLSLVSCFEWKCASKNGNVSRPPSSRQSGNVEEKAAMVNACTWVRFWPSALYSYACRYVTECRPVSRRAGDRISSRSVGPRSLEGAFGQRLRVYFISAFLLIRPSPSPSPLRSPALASPVSRNATDNNAEWDVGDGMTFVPLSENALEHPLVQENIVQENSTQLYTSERQPNGRKWFFSCIGLLWFCKILLHAVSFQNLITCLSCA